MNYRPISVLPCFSKFLGRVMYNRIFNFVNSKSILYEHQYGFRKSYSTSFAIIQLMNSTTSALDRKEFKEHCLVWHGLKSEAILVWMQAPKLAKLIFRGTYRCCVWPLHVFEGVKVQNILNILMLFSSEGIKCYWKTYCGKHLRIMLILKN